MCVGVNVQPFFYSKWFLFLKTTPHEDIFLSFADSMVPFYFTGLATDLSSLLINLIWPTQFRLGVTFLVAWSLLKSACYVNVWNHDPAISWNKSEMWKVFWWQILAVFPHLLMGRYLHLLPAGVVFTLWVCASPWEIAVLETSTVLRMTSVFWCLSFSLNGDRFCQHGASAVLYV